MSLLTTALGRYFAIPIFKYLTQLSILVLFNGYQLVQSEPTCVIKYLFLS